MVLLLHVLDVLFGGREALLLYQHKHLHIVEVALLAIHVFSHQFPNPLGLPLDPDFFVDHQVAEIFTELLLLLLQPILKPNGTQMQLLLNAHFYRVDLLVQNNAHRIDAPALLHRLLMLAPTFFMLF